MIQPRHF